MQVPARRACCGYLGRWGAGTGQGSVPVNMALISKVGQMSRDVNSWAEGAKSGRILALIRNGSEQIAAPFIPVLWRVGYKWRWVEARRSSRGYCNGPGVR